MRIVIPATLLAGVLCAGAAAAKEVIPPNAAIPLEDLPAAEQARLIDDTKTRLAVQGKEEAEATSRAASQLVDYAAYMKSVYASGTDLWAGQ